MTMESFGDILFGIWVVFQSAIILIYMFGPKQEEEASEEEEVPQDAEEK